VLTDWQPSVQFRTPASWHSFKIEVEIEEFLHSLQNVALSPKAAAPAGKMLQDARMSASTGGTAALASRVQGRLWAVRVGGR
jgi:hypothetical protein